MSINIKGGFDHPGSAIDIEKLFPNDVTNMGKLIPRQSQKVGIISGRREAGAMRAALRAVTSHEHFANAWNKMSEVSNDAILDSMFGANVAPIMLTVPATIEDENVLTVDDVSKAFTPGNRIYEMVSSRINVDGILKRRRQVAVMLNRLDVALNLFPDKTKAGNSTSKLISGQGVQTTIRFNGTQLPTRSLDTLGNVECAMDPCDLKPAAIEALSKMGTVSCY